MRILKWRRDRTIVPSPEVQEAARQANRELTRVPGLNSLPKDRYLSIMGDVLQRHGLVDQQGKGVPGAREAMIAEVKGQIQGCQKKRQIVNRQIIQLAKQNPIAFVAGTVCHLLDRNQKGRQK